MSSRKGLATVALAIGIPVVWACETEAPPSGASLQAIAGSPFTNALRSAAVDTGDSLMGLNVVSLKPEGRCLVLRADGQSYSPVFVAAPQERIILDNDGLEIRNLRIPYGAEFYALGLVLAHGEKANLSPCPGRVAFLPDVELLSSGQPAR